MRRDPLYHHASEFNLQLVQMFTHQTATNPHLCAYPLVLCLPSLHRLHRSSFVAADEGGARRCNSVMCKPQISARVIVPCSSSCNGTVPCTVNHGVLCPPKIQLHHRLCPSFHVETTAKHSNRQGIRDSRKVEEWTDGRMRVCVPQHLRRSALQEVSWSKKLLPRVTRFGGVRCSRHHEHTNHQLMNCRMFNHEMVGLRRWWSFREYVVLLSPGARGLWLQLHRKMTI